MQLFVFSIITLLILSAADTKHQTAISSSSPSVQKYGEKLKTPELTLYLTRDVIKALQDVKLPKKPVSSIETPEHNTHTIDENYNQGRQRVYAQQSQPGKSVKNNRGFVSRFFLPKDKDVIENQEKNDLAKFHLDSLKIQKNLYKQLQSLHQKNANNEERQIQTSMNSRPYNPVSFKNQEVLLQEQLKQQWNRVLDHNRAQLQGVSGSRQQNADNNQSPPILIHSEVRITKHHPVPVYKLVDVPVPKPSIGFSS